MKKTTVTIGIPAYNEEANIGFLIEDILKQETFGFKLEKILIISDGSSDNTAKIINKFKKQKIQFVNNKNRQGLARTQNEIFKKSDTDILVLLNADIMIKDRNFIEKLIQPIKKNKAELTSSDMKELKASTFIGEVLNVSMKCKRVAFKNYKNGNNLFTCHGTARAFSKKIYQKIEFKDSIGEDAYSYLFTIFNNYRYVYVNSTRGYYRVPTNFKDHELQSIRFIQSEKKLIREFGDKFLRENYHLPAILLVKTTVQFLFKYPIHMLFYLIILGGIKIKSLFISKISDRWEVSTSSKILRIE